MSTVAGSYNFIAVKSVNGGVRGICQSWCKNNNIEGALSKLTTVFFFIHVSD